VRAFLAERGDEWTLEEELRLPPGENGGDGFYAARLIRKDRSKQAEGGD
jgi:16S rRNA (cytosine967-C5)-methyltransferase